MPTNRGNHCHVEWRIATEENLLEVRSPHLADDCWLRLADRAQENFNGRFLLNGRSDRIVKIEEKTHLARRH